jgi:integrase
MQVNNSAMGVTFSLSALLGSFGENVPRDRFQDPTLLQNSNGSWYIRPWVDRVTASGVERQKKQIVLGPSSMGKREAMAVKRRVMDTINRASYVVQSQIPFGALLDEYTKRHASQLGIAAQKKYDSLIKNHIRPGFGRLQLHEITTQRVQEWLNAKAVQGEHFKSWSTRSDLRNLMSGIFEQAITWKYWQEENPITRVTAGRKRLVREKKKLTDDQTRKLLAALPAQVRTLASVALFCGLRISEVLGLQERHVDLVNGLLVIEQRFHRGNLDIVKNRKAERSVPLGYMVDDLRLLCLGDPERFVFQVETKAGRPGPHQKHFICRDDRGLLQHFLRPAAKDIGCYSEGFGWHSLRREAVTAFNASLGVTQAMRLAGHSSVEMSAEYTLADRAAQDAAVRERQVKLMGLTGGCPDDFGG